MTTFESDYICGAHPLILKELEKTNMEPLSGYGQDKYCLQAKEKIKQACHRDVEVTFLTGGTQTNVIVIASMLRDYEGVISAKTGHIHAHEAGAIEYSGNKVLELPQHQGKLDAREVETYIENFYQDENHEHMVFPGMIYISHPTEYGTLYSKQELTDLHDIAQKYNIPLFIDGARLGYGLMSDESDLTLPLICDLCDVFYIGGTKVGALCGEAVVFTKHNQPKHFLNSIKKRGGLLAKGRLLGVQFDTLFTDDLYFKISRHAIIQANKIKALFKQYGYPFYLDSPTNQQFIIVDNEVKDKLQAEVGFGFWEAYDQNHTVIRFASSWSTTDEDIAYLETVLQKIGSH